jgi:hypothetical protein
MLTKIKTNSVKGTSFQTAKWRGVELTDLLDYVYWFLWTLFHVVTYPLWSLQTLLVIADYRFVQGIEVDTFWSLSILVWSIVANYDHFTR